MENTIEHKPNIGNPRIIHVVPTLGAGGTEQNAARLVRAFGETGMYDNVVVATRPGDLQFRETLQELSSYPVTLLRMGRLSRLVQFRKIIQEVNPDSVLFHFMNIDQVLLSFVARVCGVSRIVTSAGTAAIGGRSDRVKLQVILLGNLILSCPIVCASRWIENTHKKLMPLPNGSTVVHNGIDVDRFAQATVGRERCRQSSQQLIIGMVSRLDAVKDHDVLIRGFVKFIESVPEAFAELRIIGDGPRRDELEALVWELGATDSVVFFGNRLDIPEQLNELDVFVFATKPKEGFGNVLIEAMAAGVPVIANDTPSSREVLRDGEFGLLLPSSDSESWAIALENHWRLYPNKQTPPGVEDVAEAYGIEQFRDGYLEVMNFTNFNKGYP